MELILRPVNDRFFHERLLPFLSLAMGDSAQALEGLKNSLSDEQTRVLCERLLASHIGGGLGGVEQGPWAELVDRLAFQQWSEGPSGWKLAESQRGLVADWDESLHLTLMVEDSTYPYGDVRASRGRREGFRTHPAVGLGLASWVGGQWEPFPTFPPDRVLTTQGRGAYVPREQYAFADWSWRPAHTVAQWREELERKLQRLLARERERLQLAVLPESEALLAYWLGRTSETPSRSAVFSGLGERAAAWVQELGVLLAHVREAAHGDAGLVMLVKQRR
jgi:hypothetical protein